MEMLLYYYWNQSTDPATEIKLWVPYYQADINPPACFPYLISGQYYTFNIKSIVQKRLKEKVLRLKSEGDWIFFCFQSNYIKRYCLKFRGENCSPTSASLDSKLNAL
jgi:hypothetical protein